MAGDISFIGIGSGIPIADMIDGLVAAERDPAVALLNKKQMKITTQMSGYGILKNALSSFQTTLNTLSDMDNFSVISCGTSNNSLFSATATSMSAIGAYSIEVDYLAVAQKINSQNYSNANDVVGTGTLNISVNGSSFSVAIDDSNSTLSQIAAAINEAPGNTLVSATVVNLDSGSQLILTSNNTGTDNIIEVTVEDDDGNNTDMSGLSALTYIQGVTENMSQLVQPVNAQIRIDNQIVTSQSNVFNNAISDVQITALEADIGSPATLTVSLNTGAINAQVNSFVTSYNQLIKQLNDLTFYKAGLGAGTGTEESGALIGSSTARTVLSQVRRAMTTSIDISGNSIQQLADLGITTNLDGTLSLNGDTLSEVLANSPLDVGNFFASADGFANILNNVVTPYVEINGVFDSQDATLQRQLKDIIQKREDLTYQMKQLRERLTAQFTAMDKMLAQLNNTSKFLASQLATLPTISANND